MKNLNKKQKAFCDNYLTNGFNAYQAAVEAGYTKSYANQSTKFLLGNIRIQNYLKTKTEQIEKQVDNEVDKVLTNIYLIGSGKPITRNYKTTDNLARKVTQDDSVEGPASFKDQIAAAELWLKAKGKFRNENAGIEEAKRRKLEAEAKLAESKVQNESPEEQQITIYDSWGREDGN